MIYSTFQDKKLSLLGFGTMRLPQTQSGEINQVQLEQMVACAFEHGVNYFDTAWPYHNGLSEGAIGRALSAYDRNSFYLANKYPGHQVSDSYDPAEIFEKQLEKCGVDYFDFYLLHNVYEKSMETYLDPRWGIIDYFKEQKRLGRIRHLGFSCHARPEGLRAFLDARGEDMEFCQIQLNYLDWTLQDAKSSYELLTQRGIPVWVMEPVRGGRLANLPEREQARLKAARPDESAAAWAFRFLQGLPNVKMVLSGMSSLFQMQDNVKTFAQPAPLSESEHAMLMDIAEGMKDSVPCTACRYCCDGCPMGLDIPKLLSMHNDLRFDPTITVIIRIQGTQADRQAVSCIGCGKCARICPQNIDIPTELKKFARACEQLPNWEQICREREAASKVDAKK